MERDKVIEKIRKLLALSKSPNEHEAVSALSKAQELLDRENLSLSEVREVDTSGIASFLVDSKPRCGYWEQQLFQRLAKVYDCFPYFEFHHRGKLNLWVVGHKQDTEVFVYFLDFLRKAIFVLSNKALAKEKRSVGVWDRKRAFRFRNSFGVGASTRVCERIDEIRQARLAQNVVCRALIVSRKKGVEKWASSNLNLKHKNKKAALSESGFAKGYMAGNSVSLYKGVSNSVHKKISIHA